VNLKTVHEQAEGVCHHTEDAGLENARVFDANLALEDGECVSQNHHGKVTPSTDCPEIIAPPHAETSVAYQEQVTNQVTIEEHEYDQHHQLYASRLNVDSKIAYQASSKRPEHRCIALADLLRISGLVVRYWKEHQWEKPGTDWTLDGPDDVTMHHLMHNVVAPITAPAGFTVDPNLQHLLRDDSQMASCRAIWVQYYGVMRLKFLRGVPPFQPKQAETANDPLVRNQCSASLAEMIPENAGKTPSWFVSYAWDQSVLTLVAGIAELCRVQQISEEHSTFWIDALAHNQHRLADDIGPGYLKDLTQYPGMKVLNSTMVLAMAPPVHSNGKVRAWCAYEVGLATKRRDHLVFASPEPPACVSTPTPAPVDRCGQRGAVLTQALREGEFAPGGLSALASLELEGGGLRKQVEAATSGDTDVLLAALEENLGDLHEMRAHAAATLAFTGHCSIATARALQSAGSLPELRLRVDSLLQLLRHDHAVLGSVQKLQAFQGCYMDDAQVTELGQGLKNAVRLSCASLYMDKSQCEDLTALADGLREKATLSSLDLRMRSSQISCTGLAHLAPAISTNLNINRLYLDFSETAVDSAGWQALAEALQPLEELATFSLLAAKTKLDNESLEVLARALCKQSIRSVTLKAANTSVTHPGIVQMVHVLAPRANVKKLETLKLDFKGASDIAATAGELTTAPQKGEAAIHLGEALARMQTLKTLEFGLSRTGLTNSSAVNLVTGLQSCGNLKSMHLDLTNNAIDDDGAKLLLELQTQLRAKDPRTTINLRGNLDVTPDLASQFQDQQFADTGNFFLGGE